jgi:hypothetical protein
MSNRKTEVSTPGLDFPFWRFGFFSDFVLRTADLQEESGPSRRSGPGVVARRYSYVIA